MMKGVLESLGGVISLHTKYDKEKRWKKVGPKFLQILGHSLLHYGQISDFKTWLLPGRHFRDSRI
jgi:hypothetical protein